MLLPIDNYWLRGDPNYYTKTKAITPTGKRLADIHSTAKTFFPKSLSICFGGIGPPINFG
jgi:hypothetical protein